MSKTKVILGLVVSLLLVSSMTYAQLLGLPDDAPARRIIVPFFNVAEDGTDDFLGGLGQYYRSGREYSYRGDRQRHESRI